MLYAGSDDGVYRTEGIDKPGEVTTEQVLESGRVYRVRRFDGLDGLFAASESGLYHSASGTAWRDLRVPEVEVYSVVASPSGDRLYAGTRPARVFVADTAGGFPSDEDDWRPLAGFEDLRERSDWGIPRHGGKAQIRRLCTHPATPGRVVAGLEVGGVFLSDDRGNSWTARHVEGFGVPHPDDVHHLTLGDSDTFVVSTGSGLFRSTDAGRTWARLDEGHPQWYFREAFVHDGVTYAGGAQGPSPTWDEETDHALFERRNGQEIESVETPVPDELAIGWCVAEGNIFAVTHRGSLLRRDPDGYRAVASVPTPGELRGRYLPLAWE
jgi:hypothetical protein